MNINLCLVTSDPFTNILFYVFIGIFVCTAILTLFSLPGWIKMEAWYQKKLFLALIIEVVGVVITLFGNTFKEKSPIDEKEGYVFSEISGTPSFVPVNSGINMCFNVTTFSKDASIVQPQTLKIDKSTLFGMNFFNDIKFNSVNANNKRRDCYSILKFKRDSQDNKKWVLQKGGISDCPYEYEVYDNVNGTNYRIYKGDKIIEDSYPDIKDGAFDKDKRSFLIFSDKDNGDNGDNGDNKDNNKNKPFYIYRIIAANLESESEEDHFADVFLLEISTNMK